MHGRERAVHLKVMGGVGDGLYSVALCRFPKTGKPF